MLKVSKTESRINTLSAIGLALSMILEYYGFGTFNFTFLYIVLLVLYMAYRRGNVKLIYSREIFYFSLYWFVGVLIMGMARDRFNPSIWMFFLFWSFFNANVKREEFLKIYKVVVFINIFFFFVQEAMYAASGYRIIGLITTLPLNLSVEDVASYSEKLMEVERSAAFFSEPAHLAQFLFPYIAIELFYQSKYDITAYFRFIVCAIVLLMLSSGNALVGLVVILLFYAFKLLKDTTRKPAMILFVIVVVLGVVYAASKYIASEEGEKLIERKGEIENVGLSSGFLRVVRGYYIYDVLSPVEKIVGVFATNQVKEAIKKSKVNDLFMDENDLYMNGFQTLLIRTGIIGVLLFALGLFRLWKRSNYAGQCCILLYVAISFISSSFYSYTMILYLVCAFIMHKDNVDDNMKTISCRFR